MKMIMKPIAALAVMVGFASQVRADEESALPEGYIPLLRVGPAWVLHQYIDTGYTPLSTDRLEMKVQFENADHSAAIRCDDAVYLCGVKGVRFDGCSFAHTGNYALRFASGCTKCEVTSCRLYDLGAGGIWMGSELDCRGDGCEIRRLILQPNRPDSPAPKTGFKPFDLAGVGSTLK